MGSGESAVNLYKHNICDARTFPGARGYRARSLGSIKDASHAKAGGAADAYSLIAATAAHTVIRLLLAD